MTMRQTLLVGIAASMIFSLSVGSQTPARVGSALTGRVTSAAEGAMEGVLVSAKREGSNMTITVVSNASGAYAFPQDRLAARSVCQSAFGPRDTYCRGRKRSWRSKPATAAELDLRLEQASILEKALQLTSAEWLYSYPLPEETKFATLRDCTRCHSQSKPAMSTYDARTAAYVVQRMIYSSGSTPASFQLPAGNVANWGRPEGIMGTEPSAFNHQQAAAVAAINLSKGVWQYPLKDVPATQGERDAGHPHDV